MNNWQMNELVNHIRKLITQYSEGTFPLSFKLRFSTYQGCTYCRVIVGLSWIWGVYCQAHTVALQKFQLLSKIVVIVNIWGVYCQAHTVTLYNYHRHLLCILLIFVIDCCKYLGCLFPGTHGCPVDDDLNPIPTVNINIINIIIVMIFLCYCYLERTLDKLSETLSALSE